MAKFWNPLIELPSYAPVVHNTTYGDILWYDCRNWKLESMTDTCQMLEGQKDVKAEIIHLDAN